MEQVKPAGAPQLTNACEAPEAGALATLVVPLPAVEAPPGIYGFAVVARTVTLALPWLISPPGFRTLMVKKPVGKALLNDSSVEETKVVENEPFEEPVYEIVAPSWKPEP